MRITMRMWGMKIQNATWCELFGRSRVTWAIRNWLAFNQQKTIQLCSQVPSPVTIFRDAFHDMNPHACCSNLYFWFTKKYLASSVPSCPIISPSGFFVGNPWTSTEPLTLRYCSDLAPPWGFGRQCLCQILAEAGDQLLQGRWECHHLWWTRNQEGARGGADGSCFFSLDTLW